MTTSTRKAHLKGATDTTTYVYRKIEVPLVNGEAPEWLVEERRDDRFQPWLRFDGESNDNLAVYYAQPLRNEHQLIAEGYADYVRVPPADV